MFTRFVGLIGFIGGAVLAAVATEMWHPENLPF